MISFFERLSLSGIIAPSDAPRILSREDGMLQADLEMSRSPARDLVVIAGSAGGLDALHTICSGLPSDFPAAIAVVQHRTLAHAGLLCELLIEWTSLHVRDATEGALLAPATILIAPPDLHMTVTSARTVALVGGGMIHHVLSSADPLFSSAACVYRDRLTAVVLTGGDGDGSAGVRSVKLEGGMVFAQDPDTAFCGDMPRSSIATGMVDRVLALENIAGALIDRVRDSIATGRERPVSAP